MFEVKEDQAPILDDFKEVHQSLIPWRLSYNGSRKLKTLRMNASFDELKAAAFETFPEGALTASGDSAHCRIPRDEITFAYTLGNEVAYIENADQWEAFCNHGPIELVKKHRVALKIGQKPTSSPLS